MASDERACYPHCPVIGHARGVCDCEAIDEYVETARREGHAAGVAEELERCAKIVRQVMGGGREPNPWDFGGIMLARIREGGAP